MQVQKKSLFAKFDFRNFGDNVFLTIFAPTNTLN